MRADAMGLFWEDVPTSRKRGERELGPVPEIPETGWRPPTEFPNIRDAPWIGVDCETYDPELNENGPGWARGIGHICGVSLSWPGGKVYLPMRHTIQKEMNLDPETVLRYLQWALGGKCPKIGANIMYDIGWLRQEGVIVVGKLYDVQYAEALLNSTSKLALEELGWKWLRRGKLTETVKEWARAYYMSPETLWRRDIYRCPVTLVGPYAEEDAQMPYEILMKQWPQLVSLGLLDLFEMECGLIRLLIDMRFKGITIDLPYAHGLKDKFDIRAAELQKQVDYVAGMEVNTNAAESLARAFDKIGLTYGRTEPTASNPEGQPSFTKNFMMTVNHPFARLVIDLKGIKKLNSTFVQSYLLDSHVNGKVYCSFHPLSGTEGGARTGRFSSSEPNLQNIPIRTEEGKWIRAAFICDDGHKQVRDHDYSQIEYRLLAHYATGKGADEVRYRYSNDPSLDYHKMIGGFILDITGQDLIREQIKTLNFAIVYGLGDETLAWYMHTGLSESKKLKKVFHEAVPFAKTTMDSISQEAGRLGYITTILGRRNTFDLWEPDGYGRKTGMPLPYSEAQARYGNSIVRAYLYRALNYRLQGSAAEIMKKTMLTNYEQGVFDYTGVPRLTVHDELWFSEPEGVPPDAWEAMQRNGENSIPLSVPVKFAGKVGANWALAH